MTMAMHLGRYPGGANAFDKKQISYNPHHCMTAQEARMLLAGGIRNPERRESLIKQLGECQACKDTFDLANGHNNI